jgi:hypothetical protein
MSETVPFTASLDQVSEGPVGAEVFGEIFGNNAGDWQTLGTNKKFSAPILDMFDTKDFSPIIFDSSTIVKEGPADFETTNFETFVQASSLEESLDNKAEVADLEAIREELSAGFEPITDKEWAIFEDKFLREEFKSQKADQEVSRDLEELDVEQILDSKIAEDGQMQVSDEDFKDLVEEFTSDIQGVGRATQVLEEADQIINSERVSLDQAEEVLGEIEKESGDELPESEEAELEKVRIMISEIVEEEVEEEDLSEDEEEIPDAQYLEKVKRKILGFRVDGFAQGTRRATFMEAVRAAFDKARLQKSGKVDLKKEVSKIEERQEHKSLLLTQSGAKHAKDGSFDEDLKQIGNLDVPDTSLDSQIATSIRVNTIIRANPAVKMEEDAENEVSEEDVRKVKKYI